MLARMMRDAGTLYFLLAIYFAVNAAVRIALPGALEMQEARLLFAGQWLAPGYGGQAPLAVWMQYWVSQHLGANALGVVLLENLLLFTAYAFVGWAAFLVIRNRAIAIMAVLGMLLLPQVSYELQRDGGVSVAVLMATAFFLVGLFAMLERGSLFGHVLAGLGIGVGLLASYEFIILLAAALICMLPEPIFRARLINWRIIFTLIFAGASAGPHLLWVSENLDLVIAQTLDRVPHHAGVDRNSQIIEGLFSLVAAFFGFVVPTFLVYWLAFGRRFPESWQASSPWTRLVSRIFLLVLLALIALIVFGDAAAIRDRWLVPVFFMLPLYFSLKLDALNQTIGNAPKRFGVIVVLILIAVPMVLAGRVPAAMWTGRDTKINVPTKSAIEAILAAGRHSPLLILAEDAELAGNIRLGAPDHAAVIAPGVSDLHKDIQVLDAAPPLLIVWRSEAGDAPLPEPLRRLLATKMRAGATEPPPAYLELPYNYARPGKTYRLGYAWYFFPSGF